MSIIITGSAVSRGIWQQVAGTRREIVDELSARLQTVGWTVLAGGGTADVTLQSAALNALRCRVRLLDPGAGNCAQVIFSGNDPGRVQAGPMYLLPAVGKNWDIWCTAYGFAIAMVRPTTARGVVIGGQLATIPFLPKPTDLLFAHSNAQTDTDATARTSFRTRLGQFAQAGADNVAAAFHCEGNDFWSYSGGGALVCTGAQRLYPVAQDDQTRTPRFRDGTLFISDPLLGWGRSSANDYPEVRGQIPDCLVLSGPAEAGTEITWAGRQWLIFTDNNTGAVGYLAGTLGLRLT